jgi:hypothetical protein
MMDLFISIILIFISVALIAYLIGILVQSYLRRKYAKRENNYNIACSEKENNIFCRQCRSTVDQSMSFCPKCGNKLNLVEHLSQSSISSVAATQSLNKNNILKTLGKICAVIGLLIVIAFAGAIGKNIGRSTAKEYEKEKLDVAIEKELIKTSQQINKQLPMMVDSETRLDTTICTGKNVAYKYTMINLSEKDLDINAFIKEIKPMLLKNQCSNENMVKMLKIGVQYSYMYQDRNGTLVTAININKNDCGF